MQQHRHVVDIAVDAFGDARVLNFQSEITPVFGQNPVNLADGSGGNRLEIKMLEPALPAFAVFPAHHAANL